MKTAIFIERDGVLNTARTVRLQQVSPLTLEEFRVNTKAAPLLAKLKKAGFVLIVTTNQPGISRGDLSRREMDRMHDLLKRALPVDDILVCGHEAGDGCSCRKPKPGLFIEAGFKHQIALDHSYVVSDKWQDAEAARLANCTSLLVDSPWIGKTHHDFVLPNLDSIVEKILQLHGHTQRILAA